MCKGLPNNRLTTDEERDASIITIQQHKNLSQSFEDFCELTSFLIHRNHWKTAQATRKLRTRLRIRNNLLCDDSFNEEAYNIDPIKEHRAYQKALGTFQLFLPSSLDITDLDRAIQASHREHFRKIFLREYWIENSLHRCIRHSYRISSLSNRFENLRNTFFFHL